MFLSWHWLFRRLGHQFNYPLDNHIVWNNKCFAPNNYYLFLIVTYILKKQLKEKYNVQVVFNELYSTR